MSYPFADTTTVLKLPANPSELGPERPVLFHAMHRSSFEACVDAGRLLSTADSLKGPNHKILGVADHVRSRLTRHVAKPFGGRIADAVPLAWTPHTRAVLASCGRVPQDGAERVSREDIVIAVVSLPTLEASGIPMLFSDRNPLHAGVLMSVKADLDVLPWQRFRTRSFSGKGADPEELARYGAEVLAWMGVPLSLVAEFAVFSDKAASELNSRLTGPDPIKVRIAPAWFFS